MWRHPRHVSAPDVLACAGPARGCLHARRAPGGRPWAVPRSRFTLLLERLIIDLILQCSTVTGACRIAGITWDEAWGVMARAVSRGRARKHARPMPYIGVDEKAFRKGQRVSHDRARLGAGDGRGSSSPAEDRREYAAAIAASRAVAEDAGESLGGRSAHGGATGRAGRCRDGHVGAVHPGDADALAGRRRPHRLRSLSHHARDDGGRRHGAEAEHRAFLQADGASPLTKTGESSVLQRGASARPPRRDVRRGASARTQGRTRLGAQRGLAGALDLPPRGRRKRFFDQWYGSDPPDASPTVKKAAPDAPSRHRHGVTVPPWKHPITHGAPCAGRAEGIQQQDHEHQAQGGRLPQSAALHDRHLLSLLGGLDLYLYPDPGRG